MPYKFVALDFKILKTKKSNNKKQKKLIINNKKYWLINKCF
jgi:hypothetical protein